MLGDISRERFIESVNSAHDTILFLLEIFIAHHGV